MINLNNIFKIGYNNLYENSNGFYKLKDEEKNKQNINAAKLLLRIVNKNYNQLKHWYNINYIQGKLLEFINY